MKNKGITLIALIITIVVLLILAGITIGRLSGEDGIIGNSNKAKEQAEIENEKEVVEQATVEAMGKGKYGNISKNNLEAAIDKIVGEGKTEVEETGNKFTVYFIESKRYYEIDNDGNVGDYQLAAEDKNPGDITKDENGNLLDGSQEHPYEINCIEDLIVFSNMTNGKGIKIENGTAVEIMNKTNFDNKYVVLKRNLNFNSKFSYADSQRKDIGDVNGDGSIDTLIDEMTKKEEGCYGFYPIGVQEFYNGNFNGNNYRIDNMYVRNREEQGCWGLFGKITGNVENITVSGEVLVETSNYNGTSVAGIAGFAVGKVENCINEVNITASGYGVAGIVGRNYSNSILIQNCINRGNIMNNSESTAGIIGRLEKYVEVINCYNEGKIDGRTSIGGIVGDVCGNSNGKIFNCYNIGEINSKKAMVINGVGGIVGRIRTNCNIIIKNVYNTGKTYLSYTGNGAICGVLHDNTATIEIKNGYYSSDSWNKAVGSKEDTQYDVTKMEKMNFEIIKNQFNSYIDSPEDGIDTTKWKKWIVTGGKLIFEN